MQGHCFRSPGVQSRVFGQVLGCYKAVFRVMVAVVLVFRLVVMVKFMVVIRLYSGSWLR